MNYLRLNKSQEGVNVLAKQVYAHMDEGNIVIVAENPVGCMSVLKRHWNKILNFQKSEYSKTLDAEKRFNLQKIIERMENLTFSGRSPEKAIGKDVVICSESNAILFVPDCTTLIINRKIDSREFNALVAYMEVEGRIILLDD